MGVRPKIKIYSNPENYFQELITQASQDTNKSSPQPSVQYLAALLNEHIKIHSQSLNLTEIDGLTPTLALLKAQALGPEEQLKLYKKIGDFSLFMSGMFINALTKRVMDINYYKNLGKRGYELAHTVTAVEHLRGVFLDLSLNFLSYIEILHRVSEHMGITTHTNLLALYEQWVQTQSKFFEQLLRARGFDINQSSKLKT